VGGAVLGLGSRRGRRGARRRAGRGTHGLRRPGGGVVPGVGIRRYVECTTAVRAAQPAAATAVPGDRTDLGPAVPAGRIRTAVRAGRCPADEHTVGTAVGRGDSHPTVVRDVRATPAAPVVPAPARDDAAGVGRGAAPAGPLPAAVGRAPFGSSAHAGGTGGFPPSGPPAPTYAPPYVQPPKRSRGLLVGLVAATVLAVAGIVLGVVLLGGGDNSGPRPRARHRPRWLPRGRRPPHRRPRRW
jgi:hypothetical protein